MRTRLAAFAIAAAALLAGCAGASETPLPAETSTPQITVKPPAAQTCTDFRKSYAPEGTLPTAGQMPVGSTMAKIQKRGRLIAGVSADSYLLGSRNPLTDKIEGFDIDLVHEIADAILGPNARVELRVITAADRIPVLEKEQVDIVVRNMTVNCDRWKQVAFSAVYYEAGQKLLIRKGVDITGFDDYNGIPSSSQKKVHERYWRDGQELRVTVTVEDPMFLKQPASYTTRWLPQRPGYKLSPWDCDPETSRAPVKMMTPKYRDQ